MTMAIIIIITFGVRLGWIPFTEMRGATSSGQEVEFSLAFAWDAIYHAALPITVSPEVSTAAMTALASTIFRPGFARSTSAVTSPGLSLG